VERVVFTSSDKAVNPTNVMGTSKLMGERLMTAANGNLRTEGPVFTSTRFGNVLGSRGSVIPIFREQIRNGGPVTLTDASMTRFIMNIEEAVRLVIESALLAHGGEVFITKMPVMRIQDLAELMIQELARSYGHDPNDIKVKIIGTKPGEKMYEELMNQEETRRALELERYFAVLPAFSGRHHQSEHRYSGVLSTRVTNPYNSANEEPISKEGLLQFLRDNHLLEEKEEEKPRERFWPNG
jgi:FlaA1/EpsC-like NDP-sugar epimerase